MSLSIRLHKIHCIEEINEASASEEPYLLVTSVALQTAPLGLPSVHNLRVLLYGVWTDFNEGDVKVVNSEPPFWGLNSIPEDIADISNAIFVVSLMENDNGDPNAYRELVEVVATTSLLATIGETDRSVRAVRLLQSIRDALNGVDVPIPFALDDDHVASELLALESADLIPSGFKDKPLLLRSNEGHYQCTFRITRSQFNVFGAIRAKWMEMGAEQGVLGLPVDPEMSAFDGVGRAQSFQGGIISWHPETGAHAVWGLIGERWLQIGREQFGYPITDETPTPNGRGLYNHFRAVHLPEKPETSIHWSSESGAHETYGGIRTKWAEMGWEGSPLGFPVDHENSTFDSVGRAQSFQGGIISWHPETGTHVVWGLIGERWLQIGREQFGYPITDETSTFDGHGRFNHFRAVHLPEKPEASIYWSPESGAHEIFGAIRTKWAEMGWERSHLGYPVSAEEDYAGGRIQRFQGGALLWTPEAGVFVQ